MHKQVHRHCDRPMILDPEQRLKCTPPHHLVNFLKEPRVSSLSANSPGQLCYFCVTIMVVAMTAERLWKTVEPRQVGVFKDEQANKKQCVESVVKGKNEKATQWNHNPLPAQSLNLVIQ